VLIKSYSQALETGFKPKWRSILHWVDRRVFENVDINDNESFKAGKATSEEILFFLNRWYKDILLPENMLVYPGLALSSMVGNTVVWSDIPVVKLQETPTILNVDGVVQHEWRLYNDLEVRIQAWLVNSHLDCGTIDYHKMIMGPKGGFNHMKIYIDEKAHMRTKEVVFQIAEQVRKGIHYPSVGPQCNECIFRRRCKL
jgi:hypothetical protein